MPFLKMPAALRWMWVLCFLLLMMMTVYRIFLLSIFSISSTPKISILLSGLLRDAGVAAFVGLLFMVLSFFRPLHPYRSKKGMLFSFGYFSLVLFLILAIYALDLVSIKTFGQRLSGSKINSLIAGNPRIGAFIGNFPLLAFLVGVVLSGWLWWWILDKLHIGLGMLDRALNKTERIAWYSLSIAIFVTFIWLSKNQTLDYKVPVDLVVGRSLVTALKANPVFSLLFL
jgi:hypothetical protein